MNKLSNNNEKGLEKSKISLKKGAWGWEIVGKLILLLVVILVLIAIIGMLTGKTTIIWNKLGSLFTFGR